MDHEKQPLMDTWEEWIQHLIDWCRQSDKIVPSARGKYVEFRLELGPIELVCYNFDENNFEMFGTDDCRETNSVEFVTKLLFRFSNSGDCHPTDIEKWLLEKVI